MQIERSSNQIQSELGIQDIIASISERRNVARERLLSNRTRLLKALKKIKATHALVSYNGSGDSGQIDQVQIFRDNEELKPKQNVRVLVASSFFRWRAVSLDRASQTQNHVARTRPGTTRL